MTFHLPDVPIQRVASLALVVTAALTVHGGPRAHAQTMSPPVRIVQDADAGWRFNLGDFASAAMPAFDDAAWLRVDLPHDWSAAGPFRADLGSGNGYAPGGITWYRKHFTLPATLEGRVGAVEFDGPAGILGIGNGDLNSIESTTDGVHRTYQGRGLLILRLGESASAVTVRASSPGLTGATLLISSVGR